MKKYIFLQQKENLTIGALILLIVVSLMVMRYQHLSNNSNQNSEYPNVTTSKSKVTKPNQIDVPHFLPAL